MVRIGEFEVDDQTMERLCDGLAKAISKDVLATRKRQPSWVAVGTLFAAFFVPLVGYEVSQANRIAVLEAKSTSLDNAATQIAALTQKVDDLEKSFELLRQDLHYNALHGVNNDLAQTGR